MWRSIFAIALFSVASTWGYDYGELGEDWPEEAPTCGGEEQSPINLVPAEAMYEEFAVDIQQVEGGVMGTIKNAGGHTFQFDVLSPEAAVTVSNPLTDEAYQLAQFHFHWDQDSAKGSEHTHNGDAYPLEMHFVFFKSAFADLGAAVADGGRDNLLVVGQWFEIGEVSNPSLEFITANVAEVVEADVSFNLTGAVDLLRLFENIDGGAYTYMGSLTTPTCNEIVQWVMLRTPAAVTEAHLERIYSMQQDDGSAVGVNYRDVQPLNDREVMRNFEIQDSGPDLPASGGHGRRVFTHHALFHGIVATLCVWWGH